MAEIEITLPTVQYGNVKIRATPEELGVDVASPAAVGTATAVYLNLFTQGFKVGASMDVSASPTEGLKAPQGAEQSEVDRVIDETLKAAQILADGLGRVTEVESVRSVEEIMSDEDVDTVDEARKIQEQEVAGKAPWDAKVEAKPKPWQTDGW